MKLLMHHMRRFLAPILAVMMIAPQSSYGFHQLIFGGASTALSYGCYRVRTFPLCVGAVVGWFLTMMTLGWAANEVSDNDLKTIQQTLGLPVSRECLREAMNAANTGADQEKVAGILQNCPAESADSHP